MMRDPKIFYEWLNIETEILPEEFKVLQNFVLQCGINFAALPWRWERKTRKPLQLAKDARRKLNSLLRHMDREATHETIVAFKIAREILQKANLTFQDFLFPLGRPADIPLPTLECRKRREERLKQEERKKQEENEWRKQQEERNKGFKKQDPPTINPDEMKGRIFSPQGTIVTPEQMNLKKTHLFWLHN